MLFGDQCDYFQDMFELWTMLNSEQVYATPDKFGPRMVRQITWEIIKDSKQYCFHTVTEEEFARGTVQFPISHLMNSLEEMCPRQWKSEWEISQKNG